MKRRRSTWERADSRGPTARPAWRLAALFVGIVVVLAAAVILTRHGSGQSPARPAAASSAASGQPAAARQPGGQVASGACHLPASPVAVPAAAPAGVTWQIYQTIALPFSASAGPQVLAGDVARCYAHTPTGALLAAVQIAVRYALAPGWRAVLAQQVVPGAGAQVYAAQRAQDPAVNASQPGQYGQLAGFHFVAYTPAVAVIQVVTRLPGGGLQVTAMTTRWSGADWKLEISADGSPGGTVQAVSDLDGFVSWGGV